MQLGSSSWSGRNQGVANWSGRNQGVANWSRCNRGTAAEADAVGGAAAEADAIGVQFLVWQGETSAHQRHYHTSWCVSVGGWDNVGYPTPSCKWKVAWSTGTWCHAHPISVMPHPPDFRYAMPTNSLYNMYVYVCRVDY